MDTIICNARIVDAAGDSMTADCAIVIHDGIISEIYHNGKQPSFSNGTVTIDIHGKTVMPSFVDMHAHFRDPGQLQKETIETGINAAAAGGFGTVVLMPNTVPVISTMQQSLQNRSRAVSIDKADVFQSVSLTRNFDGKDTSHLVDIDCKVVPLATEDGREVASPAVMRDAMEKCAAAGCIVSCHCEDPSFAERAKPFRAKALAGEDPAENIAAAESLLRFAENISTIRNLQLATETGCRIHIAHISTKEAVAAVRLIKSHYPKLAVSAEATPHHLALTGDQPEIVNPPLRTEVDRQALIEALQEGLITAIATDHAPHTAEDKASGTPGFSGLETAFAVCNTVLVKTAAITLQQLSALMSAHPAQLLRLPDRGYVQEGLVANLVVVDPDATWTVFPELFESKGKYSPFAGRQLTGKVLRTMYHGKTVYTATP